VRDILREHVPHHQVWAFGSRARGTARRYSDLDLAIITEDPMPLPRPAALKEAFSESVRCRRGDAVQVNGG
jgi:type I restriction enzyme S subunit